MTTHTVAVGDMTVRYEEEGAGLALILLHGGLATAAMSWTESMPELAQRYRVIAPDSRGHGGTDNPSGRLAYDQMADDVDALIDALDLDRPMVAGYSDGAQIALEFALRHPGRSRAVVLGGAVSEPHDAYIEGLHRWGFPSPGTVDLETMERDFGPEFYAETRAAHVHAQSEEDWLRFLEQISELWLTVPRYTAEQLRTVTEPTLVIAGDRDEMAALDQAERLYRGIPTAELAIVPNADHSAANDPIFWAIVGAFLDRHTSDSVVRDPN